MAERVFEMEKGVGYKLRVVDEEGEKAVLMVSDPGGTTVCVALNVDDKRRLAEFLAGNGEQKK